jgi:exosortase
MQGCACLFFHEKPMSTIYAAPQPETRDLAKNGPAPSLLGLSALIVAAYVPLVMTHGQYLWMRPHYQFFPLILLGAAVLAWSRSAELKRLESGSFSLSIVLAASAWLALAGAELLNSSWLAAVAALVFALAVLYGLGGKALVRPMLPAWIFLWLLVPPPFGFDYSLILRLQTLTTRWSSTLLDLVGVFHGITGHVIEIGGQQLFVEEACAGINSLFSILACALFYVFYTRMRALRAVVILLASLLWVLLANVARVFLVAYLLKRWDVNLALGWRHDALGFALFGVALGLIWSSNRLILFLTPFLNKRPDAQATPSAPFPTVETEKPNWGAAWQRSWLNSWAAGAAFASLLVGHFCLYGITPAFASGPGEIAAAVHTLNEDSLPRELDGWRREKMSEETRSVTNAFGQYSKIWAYRGQLQNAVVSLDYPFASWHELTECYYGQGWQVETSTNLTAPDSKGPTHYCELKMKKAGSRFGYLLFCQFDSAGQLLTPRDRDSVRASLQRQESALKRLLAWNNESDASVKQVGAVYQFQLFVETFAPLPPVDQAKTTGRFFAAYEQLHSRFQ